MNRSPFSRGAGGILLPRYLQWTGAGLLSVAVVMAVFAGVRRPQALGVQPAAEPQQIETLTIATPTVELPPLVVDPPVEGIPRLASLHTEIPERPNYKIVQYTVEAGDSAWSIARQFNLQPESILWGNNWINAEAGSLQIGTVLNILPVDGVLHTVGEGDTLERIQLLYGTPIEDIVAYPGNNFPLEPPYELTPGQKIIVPGGQGQVVWQEPGPKVVAGMGRKSPGLYDGPLVYTGTGYFIWPIAPPIVITQNYWGAHPALDMGTYYRQPVFASDAGTVIFSGWSEWGYGHLVIIDHGNGFWTYYAHNAFNLVEAGQGVLQGQQIAESGSTGNSTGEHVDFRIRVDGGSFLNPLDFLPPKP